MSFLRRDTLIPGGRALPPETVFLASALVHGLLTRAALTTYGLYAVSEAGLSPMQRVLAGTALELTAFVAEIPTGMLADAYSRRLSILVGYLLFGVGFIATGAVPSFAAIVLGGMTWGIGWTFTSGAREAWIADEIGEDRAAPLYLRAAQARHAGALAGIPVGVGLALVDLQLPLLAGGGLLLLLAFLLAAVMGEAGFPADPSGHDWRTAGRRRGHEMLRPVRQGIRIVRRRRALIALIVATALFGAWSESLDRLFPLHLIEAIGLPGRLAAPIWFGLLDVGGLLGALAALEATRRLTRSQAASSIARAIIALTVIVGGGALVFALSGSFIVALLALWSTTWAREAIHPLRVAWANRGLEPRSRATVLSMVSQADAMGQVAGGPAIGALAEARSVGVALVAGTGLLGLSLPLYGLAARRGATHDGESGAGPRPEEIGRTAE